MKTIPIVLAIAAMAACAALAADDDAAHRKDLAAVIALQGKPCGEVVKVEVKGDNDYVATCKDGNRYRVRVNEQGRVVVEAVK